MTERMFDGYPDVIRITELMDMLHIGRNCAYALLKAGHIRTVKTGKKYIIPQKSVIEFLERGIS